MPRTTCTLALAVLATLAACVPAPPSADSDDGTDIGDAATWVTAPLVPHAPLLPLRLLARTASDELAIVSPHDGHILASVPLGDGDGTRDVDLDSSGRAWAFVGDGEDTYGEIVSAAVTSASIGPLQHEAWIDGDARVLATSAGLVVFEADIGARWTLLSSARTWTSSLPAPTPLAAWVEGGAIGALTSASDGSGALERWTVTPAWSAQMTVVEPVAANDPPDARAVRLADGRAFLVETSGSVLGVRPLAGGAFRTVVGTLPSGARVAAAAGAGSHAVAIVAGADRIVSFGLDPNGAPTGVVSIPLPGHVAFADGWFSRDLAVLGSTRVAVATSTGVVAVTVGGSLAIDPAFQGTGLRGPLVSR